MILGIERKLYDVSKSMVLRYDYSDLLANTNFVAKSEKQFLKYAASTNIVDPMSIRETFSQNNPYTWNYFYTTPSMLPTTEPFVPVGDWRQLYENVFYTAYPHLEPWKTLGYFDKPSWWDAEYADGDTWLPIMWSNILIGLVPAGKTLPNGNISNGISGEAQGYSYLPVVTTTETLDGYTYGQLLPPYWNTVNNGGVSTIRSLFDPNSGDEMVKPNVDYTFGQIGDFEYNWMNDISFVYDMMVVS